MKINENAKKLLIVVDMINGFMKEGTLADQSTMRIVPEVTKIIDHFVAENLPIVAFKDSHQIGCPEFEAFPPHCLEGEVESELINELKRFEDKMLLIAKNATMGLTAPLEGYGTLIGLLNAMKKLEELVLVGVCTDICIMNNAIPAKNHFNQIGQRVEVIVPKKAVDTYDYPGVHDKDEWNEMAFRFLNQAKVDTPEEYEIKKGR